MSKPVISVSDLTKNYTTFHKESGFVASFKSLFVRKKVIVPALKQVSLEIGAGEIIGLLGPNGAGKTTLTKLLTGVMHPSGGSASVLGFTPWERRPEYLRQITLVMGQKYQLWWDLPPKDTFYLHKHIYEIEDGVFEKRLKELCDLLEVNEIITIPTRKLSLGQRMKCELIAALLHEPQVVFLDEPTIGLDVVSQKRIRDFLRAYNKRTGATIMLTSHYMEDIRELCQRVMVIDLGKIMIDTSYQELVSTYAPNLELEVQFKEWPDEGELAQEKTLLETDQGARMARFSVRREEKFQLITGLLKQYQIQNLNLREKEASDVVREIFQHKTG